METSKWLGAILSPSFWGPWQLPCHLKRKRHSGWMLQCCKLYQDGFHDGSQKVINQKNHMYSEIENSRGHTCTCLSLMVNQCDASSKFGVSKWTGNNQVITVTRLQRWHFESLSFVETNSPLTKFSPWQRANAWNVSVLIFSYMSGN